MLFATLVAGGLAMPAPMGARTYDVVVLGATGFTGRLAARYLAERYGPSSPVRWAIAARSASKLAEIKRSLPGAADVAEIICDTSDAAAVDALVVRLLPDGHGGLILHLRPAAPAGLKAGDRVGVHLPPP